MDYKTIDLCAGIGGIRKGFEMTGRFENVLSAEIDRYAAKTYEHLYGDDPLNDVTTDLFCTECGKTWLCLECGAEMPKEDLYCTNCGIERGCWKCSHCQTTCSGPADSCKTCKTPRHEPGSP